MANVIKSTEKNPAVVIDVFIKELEKFIAESTNNLNKMKRKHQQMAAVWKGKQYDDMTKLLSQSIKDAAKELLEMQKLREQLIQKSILLKKPQ